jgi:hypothetical protein
MDRRLNGLAWALVMVAMVPASAFLWFVGGVAACGEEAYDTPPGSLGDSLCSALVEPVVPWAALAAAPLALGLIAGLIGLRQGSRRLVVIGTALPPLLIVLGVFCLLAVF